MDFRERNRKIDIGNIKFFESRNISRSILVRLIFFTFLFAFVLTFARVHAETKTSVFPVKKLDRIGNNFSGGTGFYAKDLTTGATYEYNSNERFPTASVIKFPLMIELYRQVERGEISLDERRPLATNISGNGILGTLRDAPELTLRDYYRAMMCWSDNMSTDMLMRAVRIDAVNKMLNEFGLHNIRLSVEMGRYHYRMKKGMENLPTNSENDKLLHKIKTNYNSVSFTGSLENNVASAYDMGILLEKLYRGELASPERTNEMIDLMKTCRDKRMIPAHLRRNIVIAHKYGSSGRIKGDVGIVYLPTGPMIIAGFALADGDGKFPEGVIADMTRAAVGTVAPEAIISSTQ